MDQKIQFRKRALNLRATLSPRARWQKSRCITGRVLQWLPFIRAQKILLYASFRDEVETWPLLRAALAQNKEIYLPRTLVRLQKLAIHRLRHFGELFPGAYGILEPSPRSDQIDPSELDLIICPGVAFDSLGGRIGYGGGFYDRLLIKAPEVPRAALAFACQIFPELPLAPHDVRMDVVITEFGLLGTFSKVF